MHLKKSSPKKERAPYIDIMRGYFLFAMIVQHFGFWFVKDGHVEYQIRQSILASDSLVDKVFGVIYLVFQLHGGIAACLFIFLSGFSFMFLANSYSRVNVLRCTAGA